MPVETATSRIAIRDRLTEVLQSVEPPLVGPYRGHPRAHLKDRVCHYWQGVAELTRDGAGLDSASELQTYEIHVFWRPAESDQGMEALELEKADAAAAIRDALWNDHTLGGLVERLVSASADSGLMANIAGGTYEMARVVVTYAVFDAREGL